MKLRSAKLIMILVSLVCLSMTTHAQVTIGADIEPDANALLDLKETAAGTSTKGLLLPRVTLSSTTNPAPMSMHLKGMTVFNTASTGDVLPGYYYNDGSKWVSVASAAGAFPQQFYMPSIVLPTDPATVSWGTYDPGTQVFTIDLYTDVYARQFRMDDATTSYKSAGAGTLSVKATNELEYFIVYYDKDTFTIQSLDANGILKYKADPAKVTEKTFMNIVFKVK